MQSPTATSTSTTGSIDSLTCQWGDCHERCDSAESLYDHVCERHVGRKSTNNLNLTCNWGSCQTTTVKRDHITSHIRVHVPLKPHKCEFCGKSFKRPQDLKKHVKTHADESVLLRSPDAGSSHQNTNTSYHNGNKHNGYIPDSSSYNHSNTGYGQYTGSNNHSFYSAPTVSTSHASNFAPVYYQMPQTISLAGGPGYDSHRGHEQLNSFFREVKNNAIDPRSYYDLGHRLGSVDSLGLPIFNNMQGPYQTTMSHNGGPAVAYSAPALPTPQYSLPFSELKTKTDLMSIDQFLQQLQETVYDSPLAPSASSPVSSTSDPPALTPSYTSDSPVSAHSSHVMSPSRSGMASYPQLRPQSSLHDVPTSYPHMDGPPASGLGNSFDEYDNRRYHRGDGLQRAQPNISSATRNIHEVLNNTSSPPLKQAPKPAEPGDFSKRRDSDQRSERSDTSNDERYEAWVQNMRIIDALRKFVRERLQKLDEPTPRSSHSPPQAGKSLYPTLRPINAS